jgi:hypothetical protein
MRQLRGGIKVGALGCQYWKLLGIGLDNKIPLFFATLLQNYLINNFIS